MTVVRLEADSPRDIAASRGGYVSCVGPRPGRSARELYRYGERGVLTRYIIPPREHSLLCCGWTVSDTLAVMAAVPVMAGWIWLMAAAFAPIA